MQIFVDTSALVAYADEDESNHLKASDFINQLKTIDRLHASNYVFDETVTRLRFTLGHRLALTFAEGLLQSGLYQIHYIDSEREKRALEIFRRYHDKPLSFTDCTSVALVREKKLDGVFAFDEDFRSVGLRVFP